MTTRSRASSLITALLVTALIGLALVLVPTLVAVPVLVAVAFRAGRRLGGRDAGFGSISAGAFMFGYAITEPHFVWEIQSQRDVGAADRPVHRIAGGLGDRCAGRVHRKRGRVDTA